MLINIPNTSENQELISRFNDSLDSLKLYSSKSSDVIQKLEFLNNHKMDLLSEKTYNEERKNRVQRQLLEAEAKSQSAKGEAAVFLKVFISEQRESLAVCISNISKLDGMILETSQREDALKEVFNGLIEQKELYCKEIAEMSKKLQQLSGEDFYAKLIMQVFMNEASAKSVNVKNLLKIGIASPVKDAQENE